MGRRIPWWGGRKEGTSGLNHCRSLFLVGFFQPVRCHPPDYGRQWFNGASGMLSAPTSLSLWEREGIVFHHCRIIHRLALLMFCVEWESARRGGANISVKIDHHIYHLCAGGGMLTDRDGLHFPLFAGWKCGQLWRKRGRSPYFPKNPECREGTKMEALVAIFWVRGRGK